METAKRQSILIVEPNAQFREELYNFLLSAGYERVDSAESYQSALEKIRETEYDVLLLDGGSPLKTGLEVADGIAASNPKTKVVLTIGAREQQEPSDEFRNKTEYQFLIKTTFARNLLYLLENRT